MNDRFKFRVWDSQNGRYTTVDPIVKCYDDATRELVMCDDDNDRYVIEQCTGLKDRNGKLIFEGDIISRPDSGRKFCVKRAMETPMFIYRPESDDESIIPSSRLSHLYKIIGNIHEVNHEQI